MNAARSGLDLSPAPGAAPAAQRCLSQAVIEWRLQMANGEQLLLTLIIPAAVLFAITRLGLADIAAATAGTLTLAVLSSAFTATAIGTGFERRAGVLKFLGTTPLGRTGLLIGKAGATAMVLALQVLLVTAMALALGWSPDVRVPVTAALLASGTASLGAWGFTLAGLLRAEATLAVANGIFLLLMFAGGTVLPTGELPPVLAAVVGVLPTAILGDGLRTAFGVSDGQGPWLAVLLLLAWAAAGAVVARRTFRFE